MTTTSSDAGAAQATYAEIFAVREFRVLFGGHVAMILGDSLRMLALSVLVYAQTGSPLLAAFAYTVGFVPQAIGGAFLLSLGDRLPPRATIVAGACVLSGSALLVAVLMPPVPVMLAVFVLVAMVEPVFSAARSGLLPEVLDGDRFVLGRSVLVVAMSSCQVVSLGAGGALLATVGPRAALFAAAGINAIGAGWSYVGLERRSARASETSRSPVLATLRTNASLLGNARIRGLLLAMWLPVSLLTGAESLAVPYAASLGGDGELGALVLAALPVGMITGNLVIGRMLRPKQRERLALPLALLVGAPLLLLVAMLPLWLAFIVFAISASGLSYELGIQRAFADAAPARARGQAFGLLNTGFMVGQGIGALMLGALAEFTGPGLAMAMGGLGIVTAVAALRTTLRPHTYANRG